MSEMLICSRCQASVESLTAEGTCPVCVLDTRGVRPPAPPMPEITQDCATQSYLAQTTDQVPTSTSLPTALPAFGHYELLGELGRGGMGIVYKAKQTGLDRTVALKIIRGVTDNEQAKIRFAAEAKALAKITHPHIVGVYDVGEESGCPYFSMEYVDGKPLSKRIQEGPPFTDSEAAQLIEELAGAVQAAHAVGVLHRDIKPGNVLISSTGVAKLTDFGLAKNLNEDQGVTVAGSALGTPAYMPPEQAEGRLEDLGPATDVYSLGATLYELLTGRPPFRGPTAGATVAKVLTEEVTPPGKLRKGLSRELEAICLKCLEKSPTRRYVSAAGLADDLTRWRTGLSTVARPLSRLKRTWRAIKHRSVWALGAIVVVGALIVYATTREQDVELSAVKKLQDGKSVTLIGPTGPPIKMNYLNGAAPVSKPDPSRPFSMQSDEELQLELMSDPGVARYRFTVEMRQTATGKFPAIGFYFCRHNIGPADDPATILISVTHHDIDTRQVLDTEQKIAAAIREKSVFTAGAELDYQLQAVNFHNLVRLKKPVVDNFGSYAQPWRRLGVEVTPERIAFLIPNVDGDLASTWQLEANSQLHRRMNFFLQKAIDRIYKNGGVTGDHYQVRGGFGLTVRNATAEFRNAVIEPLPE